MSRRRVLDFSNFTGATPDVAALVNAGWQGVILGTQFPNITRSQAATCMSGGLPVDALYVFVYWDSEDERRLRDAVQLASELHLGVWLDCEWTRTGFPGSGAPPIPVHLVTLIRKYKEFLGESYAGIYTGGWWWPGYTANSQEFSGDPLWHAAYQTTEPNFDDFRAYGGWTRPTIWQYSSNGDQGVNADLNIEEVQEAVYPVGMGIHFRSGKEREIWNAAQDPDEVADGFGLRFSNGVVERVWPE